MIVWSVVLYCSPIWALRYFDIVEKAQLTFRSTPDYTVRIECGIVKIACAIVKVFINFLMKVLKMPNSAFTKLCFLYSHQQQVNSKLNWNSHVQGIFFYLGYDFVWNSPNPKVFKQEKNNIINQFKQLVYEEDRNRLCLSEHCLLYS